MVFPRTILCLLLFLPLTIKADNQSRNFNFGIGYYSLQLYDEEWSYNSNRLNGVALSGLYAINDAFSVRGNYYDLNSGDFADTDASGYEILAYYGRGMATQGGKWYLGAGAFSEKWQDPLGEHKFNGLQLGGGFGYNWDRIALDLMLGLRDTGDYDQYLGRPGAEINTAGVLSILLSARF